MNLVSHFLPMLKCSSCRARANGLPSVLPSASPLPSSAAVMILEHVASLLSSPHYLLPRCVLLQKIHLSQHPYVSPLIP